MKIGDNVKVVGIPGGLEGETKSLFHLCLGRTFPIFGIVPVPEIGSELIQLEVGEIVGELACMHSIWIEKEFVTSADHSAMD
jgi:hypothetical protein